ncbi:putative platelet-activating factor acetylhydrolase [Rosellinia necatrix]|uniref:Putative phospholipase n=1 Tax=Rosellinia necatrix TaxID=77044 RepID=A0A1S7UKY9_ROSNE|nr:putative platelet-activating factor acetylhydrolase [Rosellinia necatrix]
MTHPTEGESSDRWGHLLSKLNPVPRFPEFTGPYKVGTVDVEIPVCELEAPTPAPDNAADIETIQFRIFYPCDPAATGKRITWLPAPQRDYLSAYIKFLGVGSFLAEAASFLPRYLHYTTIPVVENAPILQSQGENSRWPTMIFSHGLGGSRNAYSQIAGSLASHGVVVFCPEHRDGSAIASFIRVPYQQHRFFGRHSRHMVPYTQISHTATDEVHELRNEQLRIRLWELGLIHEAILNIDEGGKLLNLNKHTPSLDHLSGQLHVHEPGSIIFAGHSFGAASIVQFLKSVFYSGRPELETMQTPLYTPNWESRICRQVTQQNVTMLLDMWCFPLLANTTKPLFNLPLPAYAPSDSPSSRPPPGGNAILAVESEDFFKWREHLHTTARILSPDPSAQVIAPLVGISAPQFFYVKRSAHLNQSDFGLLFPWLTRKVFGSEAPGRALRLNLRALLQVLRINGIRVAGTHNADLVDDSKTKRKKAATTTTTATTATTTTTTTTRTPNASDSEASSLRKEAGVCTDDDALILEREGNAVSDDEADSSSDELVEAWRWIDIVGMGENPSHKSDANDGAKKKGGKHDGAAAAEELEKTESKMAGVIEPSNSASADRRVDPETVGVLAPAGHDVAASCT